MIRGTDYRFLRIASLFSLALIGVAAAILALYGKKDSFVLINSSWNPKADVFFTYLTYLGDGLIWVPLLLFLVLYKRHHFLTVLVAMIICTFLTHFAKQVIFYSALRPGGLFRELVRPVPGVRLHLKNSFPSGHTSQAFTLALLFAHLRKRTWACFAFPLIAFFVGYSRVYLAQHFLTDVTAGAFVGIVSAVLAVILVKKRAARLKAREPDRQL
jgi:membrane-associated phospholipid phosphatase